jgi:Protein of unknown function (DUF3306)
MKKAVLLAAALTLAPLPTRSQEAQRTGGREPSIEEPSRFSEPAPGSQPAVDVTALPSIGSLAADSDIRALLQPGAQAELTTVAPRRAWAIDSAIRDFIGIAENEWDFTDTTGIPGFGPLEVGAPPTWRSRSQSCGPIVEEHEFDVGPISEGVSEGTKLNPKVAGKASGLLPPPSAGSSSYSCCRWAGLRPGVALKQESQ